MRRITALGIASLLFALTVTPIGAQPTGDPIPVPEYLGVHLVGAGGELIELIPRTEDEYGFLDRIDRVEDLPGTIEALGIPSTGANPRLVLYQPGVDFDEMLFLALSFEDMEEGQLFPRVRPSREVEGLYEITFREPLGMGLLVIYRMLGEWGDESVRAVLIQPEGQGWPQMEEVAAQYQMAHHPERVRSDLRSLAVAVECYFIDWSVYPPEAPAGDPRSVNAHDPLMRQMPAFAGPFITTPIAYLSSLPRDPFSPSGSATYAYFRFDDLMGTERELFGGWLMLSPGLNGAWDFSADLATESAVRGALFDPTNGAQSGGDILRDQRHGQW